MGGEEDSGGGPSIYFVVGCFRLGVTGSGLQQPGTALAALLKTASTASGKIMRQQSRGPANETGRDSSAAMRNVCFFLKLILFPCPSYMIRVSNYSLF